MTTAIFVIAITMVLLGIVAIVYYNTFNTPSPRPPQHSPFPQVKEWTPEELRKYQLEKKIRNREEKFRLDLEVRRSKERILKEDSIKQDILNKLEERARGGDLLAFEQWKKMANIQTNKKK